MLTSALPEPVRATIHLPDGEMALLTWPKPGAPRLVFAHANGFCASAYLQMLGALADQFDIVAPDLRGHGRSALPADPARHRSWDIYARDLVALNAALDRPADLAAGHSMGGTCWLLAAALMAAPPLLALIDPAMLPGMGYRLFRSPLRPAIARHIPLAQQARRRTRHWPDRGAALARYQGKSPFNRWAPGVLEDYLLDGLSETQGGVRLSCDPDWEAANFEAHGHDLPKAARKVAARIRLLKCEHGSASLYASSLARKGAQVETLGQSGHLAPMENPERVADWVRAVAEDAP